MRRQLTACVMVWCLFLVAAACSSGPGGGTDGGGGGGGGTGGGAGSLDGGARDAGPMFDAGLGPDGGTASDAGQAIDAGTPQPTHVATITFEQTADGGESRVSFTAAERTAVLAAALGNRCSRTAPRGRCFVLSCGDLPTDAGVSQPRYFGGYSASTQTLSGLSGTHDSNNAGSTLSGPLWSAPGQTLRVSGTGSADVPAFSTKTITSPGRAQLTSPVCVRGPGNTDCGSVERPSGLSLTWVGGDEARVQLSLGNAFFTAGPFVICDFEGGAHAGIIDGELLTALDMGPTELFFGSVNETSFDAGVYSVTLRAQYTENLGGTLTLQ